MNDRLAEQFEENRAHLRAVAYRMLGSANEADDAVQETWLRLRRSEGVENVRAWLTTVVARISLDMLRSRKARREDSLDAATEAASPQPGADPEHEAVLADSVGLAMLVVLETLTPAERIAFVLHDLFAVPFDEIAPIVDRSPEAARQLASRARRRVQGGSAPADRDRQRAVVDAFLAASREGDFGALLKVLDPNVVLRADAAAVGMAAANTSEGAVKLAPEARGAKVVAETFSGGARALRTAWIDGAAGAVWAAGGKPRVVFAFTVEGGRIVAIDMLADPDEIATLDVEILAR